MDRFLAAIIGLPLALIMLKYRRQIKDFTGDIGFAEHYLGSGGTNTLIVLIAILVFVLSTMYALGTLQAIIQGVLGGFFGK